MEPPEVKTKHELPGFRPSDHPSSDRPPPPPSPPPHTNEHVGLEWDPSVDIGRSLSCDDADSSYFSAGTGRRPSPL